MRVCNRQYLLLRCGDDQAGCYSCLHDRKSSGLSLWLSLFKAATLPRHGCGMPSDLLTARGNQPKHVIISCCIFSPAQELHGVARLKVADLVSLKLLPQPLLKLGGAWPLPGTSGMALRLKYEVPLMHLGEFWQPPARLMVRWVA